VLAMMLKRMTGIPYSMTLNANIEWWGGAMREKFSEADFTIVITEWLLAEMRRDYPQLGPHQAILGRIGVDTRKWAPGDAGAGQDGVFRIVSVGRLHANKGHDVLLQAVAQVAEEALQLRLTLIGDGPERASLEVLISELGLPNMAGLTGSLSEDQIIEHMRDADLFVLASRSEPLGVVYMEAMAMAVATIGTATGGVGEIIQNGENGLLVRPGDVDSLARAIKQMMSDASLRQRLAEAGRRSIVERFDSRIGAATLYHRLTGCAPLNMAGPKLACHDGAMTAHGSLR